jgi:hypothetical protein
MVTDPTNGLYDPLPPYRKQYFHDVLSCSTLRSQMVAAEGFMKMMGFYFWFKIIVRSEPPVIYGQVVGNLLLVHLQVQIFL